MAELGLKKKEIDAIEFAFDVYDFKGDGKVDAFYAGDLLRACNLNPTLKTIAEIGGESQKGKKFLSKADCFPLFKAAKDSKDQGGLHDFVEILKLYDKNNDDTMLGHELFRLLTNLGEKLTKEETKGLMKELCEPEDDEGFMPFKPFLERMCSAEK
uniref:Myosin light chain alkali 1 n=1 Tax=Pseudodiaptomus annandalei TaxID=298510 RepID=V9P289_9MAXI|nr:myosin light chain alkali 1 [Pseudodiaptomus annandalei]